MAGAAGELLPDTRKTLQRLAIEAPQIVKICPIVFGLSLERVQLHFAADLLSEFVHHVGLFVLIEPIQHIAEIEIHLGQCGTITGFFKHVRGDGVILAGTLVLPQSGISVRDASAEARISFVIAIFL